MVRTLISYTLAAGIITPPALLSTQTSPQLEVQPSVPQYPELRTAQSISTHPIPKNQPTVVSPPVLLTPQPIAPQFVAHRPEPVTVPSTLEDSPPPNPPPETTVIPVPSMPIELTEEIPVAVLIPPPIAISDEDSSDISSPSTDLTVLRDVVSEAHITSTAPVTAYDIMSGEPLWETTEALTIQANTHQVMLNDQAHSELILTVSDNERMTVNGTDYIGGLIIRAQDNELYVINDLSGDQMTAVQPNIIVPVEQSATQAHPWYDLDGRLPQHPPQIARHGSP